LTITEKQLLEEAKRCFKEVTVAILGKETSEVETNMVLESYLFYAKMLMQMRKVYEMKQQFPAAVNILKARWHIYIGPTFMIKFFAFKNRIAIYVHEIEHLVRNHILRAETAGIKPGSPQWQLWLIAADLEINQDPVVNIPDPPLAINYKQYKLQPGRTVEQYFKDLQKVQKEQKSERNNQQNGNGGSSGKDEDSKGAAQNSQEQPGQDTQNSEQNGKGSDPTAQPDAGGTGDSGKRPEGQVNTPPQGTDSKGRPWLPQPGEKSPVNQNWEEILKQADPVMVKEMTKEIVNEAISRSQGKYPDHLEEHIKELNKPNKIHWTKYLHRYVSNAVMGKKGGTWTKPNRRLPHLPIRGKKPKHGVRVVFAVDTSGSIRHAELEQAFAELRAISKLEEAETWVVQCDAEVQWTGKLKDFPGVSNIPLVGRGGTDFRPVFEWVKKENIEADVLIFMTDGYGDYPDRPKYPVIWLKTEGAKIGVDWGLQVEYPEKD